MKSIHYTFLLGLSFALLFSCAPQEEAEGPLSNGPAAVKKPFLLVQSPDLTVPTEAQRRGELVQIQVFQSKASSQERQDLQRWSRGAVVGWNEIARELAARYNLPPAVNSEGVYPVPDPQNPLADPRFPFATPPYVSRALAYLSVAQYDGLIQTEAWKEKEKRPSAAQLSDRIQSWLPNDQVSAFPCSEATVAAASFQILRVMFPGEIKFLLEQFRSHEKALLISGKIVPSDWAGGQKIGEAAAAKALERASSDGMGQANNQTVFAGQKEGATRLGMKDLWVSQELPARPPMLPNFGAVKTWHFSKEQMISMRPARPHVVGSPEFEKELDELRQVQRNQTREQQRIANFWADGPGSYTPPGHWHRLATETTLKYGCDELTTAEVLAYVGTTLMDAGIACWDVKYLYCSPRPQQFGIKTSVGVPNFPAYTSGHSTFSGAAAHVLGHFFPNEKSKFEAKAQEASVSRIYGLIHFRIDCEVGLTHGKEIGQRAINRRAS